MCTLLALYRSAYQQPVWLQQLRNVLETLDEKHTCEVRMPFNWNPELYELGTRNRDLFILAQAWIVTHV